MPQLSSEKAEQVRALAHALEACAGALRRCKQSEHLDHCLEVAAHALAAFGGAPPNVLDLMHDAIGRVCQMPKVKP
jgi:hypothetical protein